MGSTVKVAGREAHSEIPPSYLDSLLYYASRAPAGAIVEVGVYKGGSALMLATLNRPLFLYDTFEGMPYAGELDVANPVGKFADTSAEAVQALIPHARVIKGLFPDSLVPMPPVAFVHADADQYESTKAIIEHMPKRMVRGGMILFDDFAVEGCEGCTKAVQESKYPVLIVGETGKALIIV